MNLQYNETRLKHDALQLMAMLPASYGRSRKNTKPRLPKSIVTGCLISATRLRDWKTRRWCSRQAKTPAVAGPPRPRLRYPDRGPWKVGARAQGYTSAAAVDHTLACWNSKTPPRANEAGPRSPNHASRAVKVGTTSHIRSDGRRAKKDPSQWGGHDRGPRNSASLSTSDSSSNGRPSR
jgi:hypothetical protein